MNRSVDPFIVTVEPKPDDEPIHYNSHAGQEFRSCARRAHDGQHRWQRAYTKRRRQPVLQFKIAAWHESTGWKNGTIPGNYHVTTKWRMKGISHS